MTFLPQWREDQAELPGLGLLHMGKVRNTYLIPDHPDLLLVVATDGISIFDFTLGNPILGKGMILNAMTHFWLTMLGQFGIRHHMIAAGADIDKYLPQPLKHNRMLQTQAMVVQALSIKDIEFIIRQCLTGSGLKSYRESGTVNGHVLPLGLQDGDRLPFLLDTPTSKEKDGHDLPLPFDHTRQNCWEETFLALQIFQIISGHAESKGIVFADTKFEFGHSQSGLVTLGDEVGTPDSSRFWDRAKWLAGRASHDRKSPTSLDKDLARRWGKEFGIPDLNPESEEDCRRVHQLVMPVDLVRSITQTYRYIFWRLTGQTIENYLFKMGVSLPVRKIGRVALVLGSESDLKVITPEMINEARKRCATSLEIEVHVVSCHRNPADLMDLARFGCRDAHVVIAAGGMALALPGVLDASLADNNHNIPVIGLALGEPHTESFEAARLSIKQIPGQPVVMDESLGEPYANVSGFDAILRRLVNGELPPPVVRTKKDAHFNMTL